MTEIVALDAITNMGTEIRLYRRKDRYDLYGRSHMRSNTDEYDADIGEKDEEYEEDDMRNPHHGHKKLWITVGVVLALSGWLIVFPWFKLGNYSPPINFKIVEVITIHRTHNRKTEYDVMASIPGSQITPTTHTLQGKALDVKLNTIKFLGSPKGYQLGAVIGSDSSFQFGNETDNYLNIVQTYPWAVPTVAVNPCIVQLGPFNDFNSHTFDILVSPDGTCHADKLS